MLTYSRMAPYLRFTLSSPGSSVRPRLAVLVALGSLACGGGGSQTPAPQPLNEPLARFLSAVKANDRTRLGALWGPERGPPARWMKAGGLSPRWVGTPR